MKTPSSSSSSAPPPSSVMREYTAMMKIATADKLNRITTMMQQTFFFGSGSDELEPFFFSTSKALALAPYAVVIGNYCCTALGGYY